MSRLLVAMDTATDAIAIGVGRLDAQVLRESAGGYEIATRKANTRLLPALREALERAGERITDVDGVIVGRGPGSFTGVRIGVATAKGLAQGLGVPLVGVGTPDAIAWQLAGDHEGLLGVVGDAMRGEVYPALFELSAGRAKRLSPDRVVKPGEAASVLAADERPLLLAGNGLAKHADAFAEVLGERVSFAPEDRWWPSGSGLFSAFIAAGGESLFLHADPAAVLPVYTRLSDAEEAERARSLDAPLPESGVRGAEA